MFSKLQQSAETVNSLKSNGRAPISLAQIPALYTCRTDTPDAQTIQAQISQLEEDHKQSLGVEALRKGQIQEKITALKNLLIQQGGESIAVDGIYSRVIDLSSEKSTPLSNGGGDQNLLPLQQKNLLLPLMIGQ